MVILLIISVPSLRDACYFLLTMQGQCKPNAKSSLYAEVQPVLAFHNAKVRHLGKCWICSVRILKEIRLFFDVNQIKTVSLHHKSRNCVKLLSTGNVQNIYVYEYK